VFAGALTFVACGNDNTTANKNAPPAAAPAENTASNNQQPVTLTGCLQKGDGRSDFILTQANTASPVGTSGAASDTAKIEREQREAAAHSYRLDGDRDELDKLVGHQVRVSGNLTDKGDMNRASAENERGAAPTSGSTAPKGSEARNPDYDRDRAKISEGDLAKVDVKSIESVSDSCGAAHSQGAKRPAKR
jgi:hypothetical protein